MLSKTLGHSGIKYTMALGITMEASDNTTLNFHRLPQSLLEEHPYICPR